LRGIYRETANVCAAARFGGEARRAVGLAREVENSDPDGAKDVADDPEDEEEPRKAEDREDAEDVEGE
jgi:hypothetical protein